MNGRKVRLCGVRVDNVTMKEALEIIENLVRERKPSYIVTPNADHMIKLRKDEEFRRIYEQAALVLADGMSLLWVAQFLGTPLVEKVSGSDLMPQFCRLAAKRGHKLFFLGGREGAAVKAKSVLEEQCPGIRVVGVYSPPMGFEKNPEEGKKITKMIREAAPDVLFVGLGAPKQEKWVYKNFMELGVPVSVGVGITFEFIAGMVRRAPRWMQLSGLEWLWRLLMEPKRLWKRYLIDDPFFFWLAVKQKWSGRS